MGDEVLEFTIGVYSAKRMENGYMKTRYTAIQSVDKAYVAAESFDSPEDAVARLAIAASKRGGFIA